MVSGITQPFFTEDGNLLYCSMEKKLFKDLEIGDRFYFVSDRQRKVWIVDYIEERKGLDMWQQPVIRKIVHIKDDLFGKKEVTKNQDVVFIRNGSSFMSS